MLELPGDKTELRQLTAKAEVPIVPGSPSPVTTIEEARREAARIGFRLIVKAAFELGGGRGMRVVESEADLVRVSAAAQHEAARRAEL